MVLEFVGFIYVVWMSGSDVSGTLFLYESSEEVVFSLCVSS